MTFGTGMNSSFLQNEAADGDRSSLRSSSGGGGSTSDEYSRRLILEEKIEKMKEQISQISCKQEDEVAKYLREAGHTEMSRGSANPQLIRIRQNFERINNKHSKDIEALTRKLEGYQQRLSDMGLPKEPVECSSRSNNIVSSVGHGIRKTGEAVRGVADTVINAPMDIANIIKSSFGSADNVNDTESTSVGQSVFYARSENLGPSTSAAPVSKATPKSSTLPPGLRMLTSPSINNDNSSLYHTPEGPYAKARNCQELEYSSDDGRFSPNQLRNIQAELKASREQNTQLQLQLQDLMGVVESIQNELKRGASAAEEDRFRIKKLEADLSETQDLHQAELRATQQDLNSLIARVQYQHMECCSMFKELSEKNDHKIQLMENSIKDRFPRHSVSARGANIVVELLKLMLFLTATVLDFFKPFTGTRTRTGLLLTMMVCVVLLLRNIDSFLAFLPSRRKSPPLMPEL